MIRAGLAGATGYVGIELIRLLSGHPHVEIAAITAEASAGQRLDSLYGHLAGLTEATPTSIGAEAFEGCQVIFTALPHGSSSQLVAALLERGARVIDLGADFRLKDLQLYRTWYGFDHPRPDLLSEAVYGLPELHRAQIRQARLVACPGCYPTSAALALAPLLARGLADPDSLVLDSKSGLSGVGRVPSLPSLYCEVEGNTGAYAVAGTHRHTPEIEQVLGGLAGRELSVSFTPHRVPMTRGVLTTAYARVDAPIDLTALYLDFYRGEPFIQVRADGLPATRQVAGSNRCHLAPRFDRRTRRVTVISVLDNLVKGAAGQALQNMNLMFGLEETTGLELMPLFP